MRTRCGSEVVATRVGTLLLVVLFAGLPVDNTFAQARSLIAAQSVEPPNDEFFVEAEGDVRVTIAVASAKDTLSIFGFSLYSRNIQPVWIQIENSGDEILWFLPTGVDEAYFTPIEASFRHQKKIPILDWAINRNYHDKNMSIMIGPGEVRSGYVFTRVDQGTKSFNVDVASNDGQTRMTFFIPVPGLRLDHYEVDWESLYAEDELQDVDVNGLIEGLEALPCCVTDKKGKINGDPLNLVIVGDIHDAYYGFMRAGWDETETIHAGSLMKTLKSAVSGSDYRYSPVSALYVFGRAQDAALQKTRSSIHNRNHLRLWLTPMRFEGKPVWIGQISRDIGVRFTKKTVTTHKIDPDGDETREYLLENLAYAQSIAAFGYVGGVGKATFDAPRGNLTGDPYFTDGLRIVLFIAEDPVDISEIEFRNFGLHPVLVQPE